MPVSVCLVRFHDGSAKTNWGGRGTSLGLARAVAASPDHRLDSVINGELIVRGFGDRATTKQSQLERAVRKATGRQLSRAQMLDGRAVEFEQIPDEVDRLISQRSNDARIDQVLRKFERCDEVWVNGEGDFILTGRRSLRRTLLLMHLAMRCDRPVHLVNSILSDPPVGERNSKVVDAVGAVLAACALVRYRDPVSLQLHRSLYPNLAADWAPDALFLWAPEGAALHEQDRIPFGPGSEALPVDVEAALTGDRPVVALSGSSSISSRSEDLDDARASLRELIGGIREQGSIQVVVATDDRDRWMIELAKGEACLAVGPAVPLASALDIVGRVDLFASGRYHPSILASLGGTPVLTMTSNSHKTRSLLEVLGETAVAEAPFFSDRGSVAPVLAHIRKSNSR